MRLRTEQCISVLVIILLEMSYPVIINYYIATKICDNTNFKSLPRDKIISNYHGNFIY